MFWSPVPQSLNAHMMLPIWVKFCNEESCDTYYRIPRADSTVTVMIGVEELLTGTKQNLACIWQSADLN